MINKLKSFVDIDPALPGPPTEGSNGLKFVSALKSDVSNKVGDKINKFALKKQVSIGDTAGNFVGGTIQGVGNFSQNVLSGNDTGILGNTTSKIYNSLDNITSKVGDVTGGITSKVGDVAGGVTSKVGVVGNTINEKTNGIVDVSGYSPYNFDAANLSNKSIDRLTGNVTDKISSGISSIDGKTGGKIGTVSGKLGSVSESILNSSIGEKVGGYVGSKIGQVAGSKIGTAVGEYLPNSKIAGSISSNSGTLGSKIGKFAGEKTGIKTQAKIKETVGKRIKVVKIPKLPDASSINNKINNTVDNI
jgi:hypothetical protein